MRDYIRRLSELFNAPVGGVGTLLLYTHYNWGTSYVLGYHRDSKRYMLRSELVIKAKTLCQM
ncbi:hypothetical protein LCGC14_1205870, partial [marine sediment metagenome]